MNKLTALMSQRVGKRSTYEEVANATNFSETTPIINNSSPQSPKKKSTIASISFEAAESSESIESSSHKSSSPLPYKSLASSISSSSSPSCTKAICLYLKENFTIVIIVILLLAIFALSGDNASMKNQAANLVEDKQSAGEIRWRPCQMYLNENNENTVKVIQTSLGDPSTHWGQIPCLVRNEHNRDNPLFKSMSSSSSKSQQWNWLFNNVDFDNNDAPIPLEYGMPSANIKVDFDTIAHPDREPIKGFGGAFTEASALNYMTLNDDGKAALMSLLFGKKEGLGYSLGRVHMNSCDFSVKSYNFDDVDGDFNLTNFDMTVEHDVTSGMIEMMLHANTKLQDEWLEGGGINIIASPWSPPAWMKKPTDADPVGALHAEGMTGSAEPNCLREGTGPDSKYAASWALYCSKFLAAYKAWGINLFAVTVQNEPEFPAPWEACAYNPENQAEFITNHLGPVLRRDHPDVKLLIFDHNKDHAVTWGNSILNQNNPASEFVDGTGIHWYAGGMDRLLDGAQGAPNMHRFMSMLKSQNVKPDHLVLGTEACHCPSTGYAGGDLSVAWARAERYGHTILSDLAAGSNGWVEWNLVLDALGGPNHLGNMCDAPILTVPYRADGEHNITVLPEFEHADFPFGPVDGDTRTREELNALGYPAEYLDKGIVVQPMFYYMGHISRHVRPGSRAVHAIVDQADLGRTFLQKINGDVTAGGGINDLARTGIEITLWPCEGSTRQQFTVSKKGQLQVFGHDWLGAPTSSCIGSVVDPSFEGLLLSPCDDSAGLFRFEPAINSTEKIIFKNSKNVEGQNCLVAKPLQNNGGAYGPRGGAQVAIGSCDEEAALWNIDASFGEISSNFFKDSGGEVCATTGWPFLQVGAFVGHENQKNRTIVVLNEASEPANYVLRNGHGEVFMTNSIDSHSIQTVIY